mgnify:CR=1 FL=1
MLPKNDVPNYTLNLKSDNKAIKYRPFLVKEEKIMLMAAQSQDETEIKDSIIQIIRNLGSVLLGTLHCRFDYTWCCFR